MKKEQKNGIKKEIRKEKIKNKTKRMKEKEVQMKIIASPSGQNGPSRNIENDTRAYRNILLKLRPTKRSRTPAFIILAVVVLAGVAVAGWRARTPVAVAADPGVGLGLGLGPKAGLGVSAQTRTLSAEEILKRLDDNITAGNKVMTAKMIIHLRRASRTVEFKSYVQGTEKTFTEYLAPPREKGTKMLKLGDQLWMYSPWTERTILISGHMLRQSVMGSDLSYEDMMEDPKLSNSYTAELVGEETIRLGEGLRAEQAGYNGYKRNAPDTVMTGWMRTEASHSQEGRLHNGAAGRYPINNEPPAGELSRPTSTGPNTRGHDYSVETKARITNNEGAPGIEQLARNEEAEVTLELPGTEPMSEGLKLPRETWPNSTGTRGPTDTDTHSYPETTRTPRPPAEQTAVPGDAVAKGTEVSCWVLELSARREDVAYPRRKLWVDKERFVAVREERYARGGTLLKRTEVLSLRKFGKRWVPDRAVFKDMLKAGQGTEFVVDSIEFDAQIPDYIFTRAALK
ncbi:MAG: outer membrane lipoprotein-sorting protein [Candidatus Saccharicenans sp.]